MRSLSITSRQRFGLAATLPAAAVSLALAGCASTPVAYQGLASAGQLQGVKDDEAPFQFRSADTDFGNYEKILLDPVAIYTGSDAQFGSSAEEDRKAIAAYMQQVFAKTLGKRYRLADTAAPDTVRLHLTLTGIETSVPVISTITHLAPVGLIVNTGLEASGRNGTFLGSVSYAAEIFDSATGKLLYAYVTRQTPDALDVTASFGSLAAAREGVRIGAVHLGDQLAKNRLRTVADSGERVVAE